MGSWVSDPLCASRPRGDVDARDPVVSAAFALWRARLRCAEPRDGSPGGSDYRPPAGCEASTQVRWERGEWALASTPAAFESRALSVLAMAMGPPIPAAFTLKLIIALLLLSALRTAAYTIYIYFYSKHDVGKIAPYLFTVPMLSSCSAT